MQQTIIPASYLIAFLITLFICYLSTLSLKKNLLFFSYNFFISIWLLFSGLMVLSKSQTAALYLDKLCIAGSIIFSVFFFYYLVKISKRTKIYLTSPLIVSFAGYLLWALFFTDTIVKNVQVKANLVYFTVPGSNYSSFSNYSILLAFGGLSFLLFSLWKGNKSVSVLDRSKNLQVLLGTLIGYSGGALLNFLVAYNYLSPIYLIPANFFIILYVSVIAYTALKFDLLSYQFFFARSTAYFATISLLLFSILIPFIIFENQAVTAQLISVLTLFWAFTFRPLSLFLITTAKRKFIKGFYDASTVIQELTEMLEVESSRRTIFEAMLFALDDALEIEDSGFLVAVRDETETRINFYQHYPKDIEYPFPCLATSV